MTNSLYSIMFTPYMIKIRQNKTYCNCLNKERKKYLLKDCTDGSNSNKQKTPDLSSWIHLKGLIPICCSPSIHFVDLAHAWRANHLSNLAETLQEHYMNISETSVCSVNVNEHLHSQCIYLYMNIWWQSQETGEICDLRSSISNKSAPLFCRVPISKSNNYHFSSICILQEAQVCRQFE